MAAQEAPGQKFDRWLEEQGLPARLQYESGVAWSERTGHPLPPFRAPYENPADYNARAEKAIAASSNTPSVEQEHKDSGAHSRPSYLHTPSREEILADMVAEHPGHGQQTAVFDEVIDGRRSVYGDPKELFPRAAQIWSGILGHEVTATDVSLMLIGYKLLRTAHTPDYSDNSDDIEGYLAIFRELVGDDMIQARSVADYLIRLRERESKTW